MSDQCDKRISLEVTFVDHQRIHNREKPFRCHWCDASFEQQRSLVSPQKKIIIGKSYINMIGVFKSNFINHQEIHSGKESFECDQ